MQVYEKLDLPIKSQCSQDIPLTTQQTLLYFWKASHKFVHSSPELSQTLLRSFVELSRESCAEYPAAVTQRICTHCCTLLLPGLTATCRLRPSSSRRKRTRQEAAEGSLKSKNEIVSLKWFVVCLRVFCVDCGVVMIKNRIICQSPERELSSHCCEIRIRDPELQLYRYCVC